MKPIVSIIMGSTSDLPVMEKAAAFLDSIQVPFEMNALSAHRTPAAVEEFAKGAAERGIKVIIAAAGMAAALPGVIAANTSMSICASSALLASHLALQAQTWDNMPDIPSARFIWGMCQKQRRSNDRPRHVFTTGFSYESSQKCSSSEGLF